MNVVHIEKCRYEIQELKDVPVWYTGKYRPISSTGSTSDKRVIREWIKETYVAYFKVDLHFRNLPGGTE
jgi:hypothetical protein